MHYCIKHIPIPLIGSWSIFWAWMGARPFLHLISLSCLLQMFIFVWGWRYKECRYTESTLYWGALQACIKQMYNQHESIPIWAI